MIFDYFDPVNVDDLTGPFPWTRNNLGHRTKFNGRDEIDLDGIEVAVLGVTEDRGSVHNPACGDMTGSIRSAFYRLYDHFPHSPGLVDLGNIRTGASLRDTQAALSYVLQELTGRGVISIILGAGHDLTYGQYGCYELAKPRVNLVVVDERIDVEMTEEVHSESHLYHILSREPNYLFGFTHLAHQAFYTDPKWLDTVETLGFEAVRLGDMKGRLTEVEPAIRDADMMSIDISALRGGVAPANARTSPNGLTGEEICQICRYAGYSNSLSTLGIYELNGHFEQNHQTARLVSQMMWYMLEGITNRTPDQPTADSDEHLRYHVHLESTDHELVFIKSERTGRWWMEIMEDEAPVYIACSAADYQRALQEEIPDRWMQAYKLLS